MKKVTKIAETASSKVKLKKIRVAAYCRVSTDSDAQLESLEAQKTHYENYITSRDDWEFAGLYYDEGITGTKKDKRPELLRLIDDCKAGKVDFVITKSISRFSRNTTDCLELVRKLLALHIPIYFEKENINTGSMESELFLAILSSMAEGESVSISENNKWSIQKRFESGTYKVSYPPYGYDWDGEQMIINPEQAAVVKEIFAALLSGKGTHAIADDLNRRGIPTKRNGRWTATTIRGMLSNEKYIATAFSRKRTRIHALSGTTITASRHSTWSRIITRQSSAGRTLKLLTLLFTSGQRKKVSSKGATNTRIATPSPGRSSAASAAIPLSAGYTAVPDTNTPHGAAVPTSRIKINATCFL